MSTKKRVMGFLMALALMAGGCGMEANEPLELGSGKADIQEMTFVATGTTCKNSTRAPAEPYGPGTLELKVDGDTLTVIHQDAMYNCALGEGTGEVKMTVAADSELMKLTISERFEVEEGVALARCVCPYDLQITIPDLPEGIFDLELLLEGGTLVDRTVFQTGEDMCLPLNEQYMAELEGWTGCIRDMDCRTFAGSDLTCGGSVAINNTFSPELEELRGLWSEERCGRLDWNCPLYSGGPSASALPPWYKREGVCDFGMCQIRMVDTRATLPEGAQCGVDRDRQCAEGLYCAGPPCGTPPVVMTCKKMGACDATHNCLDTSNSWTHAACTGTASCEQGQCGWTCDEAPF